MNYVKNSLVIEKKSKFYGYLFNVDNTNVIEDILNDIKCANKKARHIVYAYKIGNIEKKYEDKEPSNSAGKPLLDIIHYNNLDNVLIVVVRYFGGELLGRGLLTRTYSKAGRLLISNN